MAMEIKLGKTYEIKGFFKLSSARGKHDMSRGPHKVTQKPKVDDDRQRESRESTLMESPRSGSLYLLRSVLIG